MKGKRGEKKEKKVLGGEKCREQVERRGRYKHRIDSALRAAGSVSSVTNFYSLKMEKAPQACQCGGQQAQLNCKISRSLCSSVPALIKMPHKYRLKKHLTGEEKKAKPKTNTKGVKKQNKPKLLKDCLVCVLL